MGSRSRARAWVLLILVLALVAGACGEKADDTPGSGGSGSGASRGVSGDTIKVGILHSLSGTMAISEVSVKDAEMLAIDEINAKGGVLGKKLVPVIEEALPTGPRSPRRRRS